jgi:hypothetical protein
LSQVRSDPGGLAKDLWRIPAPRTGRSSYGPTAAWTSRASHLAYAALPALTVPRSHDESGVFLYGQVREEIFHLRCDTYEDGCRNLLEFELIRDPQPMQPTAEGACALSLAKTTRGAATSVDGHQDLPAGDHGRDIDGHHRE